MKNSLAILTLVGLAGIVMSVILAIALHKTSQAYHSSIDREATLMEDYSRINLENTRLRHINDSLKERNAVLKMITIQQLEKSISMTDSVYYKVDPRKMKKGGR